MVLVGYTMMTHCLDEGADVVTAWDGIRDVARPA